MVHNYSKIIVIDGKYARRKANLESFHGLPTKLYYYNMEEEHIESDKKERGKWKKCKNPPHKFDLLLIHARDKDYRNLITCNVCVWYGGYEGYDRDVPEGEYKIYRKIIDIDECLNEDEANDLLLFALGKIDVPDTLLHPNHKPDIQNKIEILHDLMNPSSINKDNIKKILSLGEPGKVFLQQVKNLGKRKGTINPFDEDYIQILDELRSKIID